VAPAPVKHLVVTADDFGLAPEVNEAVRRAHGAGVLTCASLMMAADATDDAVAIGRTEGLPVGLHLTLVDGRPVLPAARVPELVDARGRFRPGLVRAGLRLAWSRRTREAVAAECRAQVEAFLATGLAMDHLNAHHHFHVHPYVLGVVIDLARRYRIPAVRVPAQPGRPPLAQAPAAAAMALAATTARRRLHRAGIATNDALFGLYETGAMTGAAWQAIVPRLGPGVTEVYCHPATATPGALPPTARHAEELAALMSPAVREALDRAGVRRVAFADAVRQRTAR
jgi:chitin disaccharide deacetylase